MKTQENIIKDFITESGLTGRIIEMHPNYGGWWWRCGYVGIDKDSPLFGVEYNADPYDLEGNICVHGGLTFSGLMPDSGLWWFGFDTAHCDDSKDGGHPEEYVKEQIELVAFQIKAHEKGRPDYAHVQP